MSRPSDDDRVEALRRFLAGLSTGDDANQLVVDIADLHMRHNTFPGEVLMELAADALDSAGVLTDFAVHGGLEPDLLDEVAYWIEQYWQYALFAAVAIVRACAEHSGTPLETFVVDLASRHAIDIN